MNNARLTVYNAIESAAMESGLDSKPRGKMSRYLIDMDLQLSAAKLTHNENPTANEEAVRKHLLMATLAGVAALSDCELPTFKE
jgi:hypothetical protein